MKPTIPYVKLKQVESQLAQIVTVKLTDFSGADFTTRLENMINFINANYKTSPINVLIPSGENEVVRDITIDGWENKKIEFVGKLKFTNCNGITFKWLKSSQVYINQFAGNETVANDSLNTLTYNGLKILNCQGNKFTINKIIGFRSGLLLHGEDFGNGTLRGTFANEINFREINKAYNPILITDLQPGWVNENVIYGGGVWGYNGLVQGQEGSTDQSSGRFHNNKFYNLEFEGIYGGTAILMHQGRSNAFQYPRFEGSGIPETSMLISEGTACCNNVYVTSNYSIETKQVKLNTNNVITNSKLIADIRNNTSRIANEMIAGAGEIKYLSNYDSTDKMNNTTVINPKEGVMITHKTRTGKDKSLLTYSDIQNVEDADMLNGFSNFAPTSGSAYPKLHYYITGENELVIGGFIKTNATPANDAIIHTLKTNFRPISRGYYTVGCEKSDGTVVNAIIEIRSDIVFRKFVGTGGTISRMCLNGIRIKLDIPLIP